MDDQEQSALATMIALREARDTFQPGSKEYEAADKEFKQAEAEYHKARK